MRETLVRTGVVAAWVTAFAVAHVATALAQSAGPGAPSTSAAGPAVGSESVPAATSPPMPSTSQIVEAPGANPPSAGAAVGPDRTSAPEGATATAPTDAAPLAAGPPTSANVEASRPAVAAADVARIGRAQAAFGLDLVGRLARANPKAGNVLVSPAGVAAVFGLLDLGADAPMRAAMGKVLGLDEASARADLGALRAALTRSGRGPFVSASTLVFDPAASALPVAIARLGAVGAEVSEMDLSQPESLERINAWVSGRTRGLIPTLLSEPLRDAAFVALNALYFKDRWRSPFPPQATRPAPFQTSGGQSVDVPMMSLSGALRARTDGRLVAVDLPYQDPAFSLVVVTTVDKPGPVSAFERAAEWLAGQKFEETSGELSMPRFEASGSFDLLPTLDALGLKAGRGSRTALSGLMEGPQSISRILQKSVLKVDEEGSEAAVATAVVGSRSIKSKAFSMTVDKPFVFALRDRTTGAVLLAGYVSEPVAAATTAAAGAPHAPSPPSTPSKP